MDRSPFQSPRPTSTLMIDYDLFRWRFPLKKKKVVQAQQPKSPESKNNAPA